MAAGDRAPVFMQLEANCACLDLARAADSGDEEFPLPRNPRLMGNPSADSSMRCMFPRARRAGCGVCAGRRAGAAADQRRQAAGERSLNKLWANEMDVGVNAAGRYDFSFPGDHFRSRTDDHAGRHAAHDVRIAGLADSYNASAANANVCLVDSAVVHDHRIGDNQIENASVRGSRRRGLPHAVAITLPPPNFALLRRES